MPRGCAAIGGLGSTWRLNELNRPGIAEDSGLIWFPGGSADEAERVDRLLDRALRNLRERGEQVRSALDLVQARRSALDAQRNDPFQRTAAIVASLFLAPGPIAALFGANTAVPGENRWSGFLLMLTVMVASGGVTYLALGRRTRERPAATDDPRK